MFLLDHQGPDQARIACSQRYDRPFVAAPCDQLADPATGSVLLVTQIGDDCPSTVDQTHTQMLVTPLGDAPQANDTTGGVLPWREADPGGELAIIVELLRFH
jgi:hypothetical protein